MTNQLKFKKNGKLAAFTLVELLIVIAVIAVLAVAVIATINPVEIIRRSNDAAKRADAAKFKTAIDIFYTSTNLAPWTLTPIVANTAYCPQNSVTTLPILGTCTTALDSTGITAVLLPFNQTYSGTANAFWTGATDIKKEIQTLPSLLSGNLFLSFATATDTLPKVCYRSTSTKDQADNGTAVGCDNSTASNGGTIKECTCI